MAKQHEALYEQFRTEPDVESLVDEIALSRTVLAAFPDLIPANTNEEKFQQAGATISMAESVSRLVHRKAMIEATHDLRFTKRDLEAFAERLLKIITSNVTDPSVLQRIAAAFRASLAADVRGLE